MVSKPFDRRLDLEFNRFKGLNGKARLLAEKRAGPFYSYVKYRK